MSKWNVLKEKQRELIERISTIEMDCEGLENTQNAQRGHELSMNRLELVRRQKELQAQLREIDNQIVQIDREITTLSRSGVDQILDAIGKQRWYFIKNKTKVLLDKDMGMLWANLDYFPWGRNNSVDPYPVVEIEKIVSEFDFDKIEGFRVPTSSELWAVVSASEENIPYKSGCHWRIKTQQYWAVNDEGRIRWRNLDGTNAYGENRVGVANILPCSSVLVDGTDYVGNVKVENKIYSEKERHQFTLELFLKNGFVPIFHDDSITELFQKIYIEKPGLINRLTEIENQMEELKKEAYVSLDFDYRAMLAKYDLISIDSSIIQYEQAVRQWIAELLEILEGCQLEKRELLDMQQSYRERCFQSRKPDGKIDEEKKSASVAVDKTKKELPKEIAEKMIQHMNTVKKYWTVDLEMDETIWKLKCLDGEMQEIERTLDESVSSSSTMAKIENRQRPGFAFVAENTSRMVKKFLKHIDDMEKNMTSICFLVEVLPEWWEECEETWGRLGGSSPMKSKRWQEDHIIIENLLQELLERFILSKKNVPSYSTHSVLEIVFQLFNQYRNEVDEGYISEYDKYLGQRATNLHKLRWFKVLYDKSCDFLENLEEILFACKEEEDRIFLVKWAFVNADRHLEFIMNIEKKLWNRLKKEQVDEKALDWNLLNRFWNLPKRNYVGILVDGDTYMEEIRQERQCVSDVLKVWV